MSSPQDIQIIPAHQINAGMPLLEKDTVRSVSPYEFLPTWFFYTPVVIQSLMQGLRHFDWALPLIVNPSIKLSGAITLLFIGNRLMNKTYSRGLS